MKTEPIQQFILKNEKNFQIAAEVASAWAQIPTAIAEVFLKGLVTRFSANRPGWKSEPYQQFFVDASPNIAFWKPAWEDQYWIVLQATAFGKDMKFGVMRDEENIKRRPLSSELLRTVQHVHPAARAGEWWEARIMMRSPATDWTKPEILWRMRNDEAFLKDVVDQMLEVAKVSERLLDSLANKR